ncbi:MAG: GAP family protein [Actinomycetes bacterium]
MRKPPGSERATATGPDASRTHICQSWSVSDLSNLLATVIPEAIGSAISPTLFITTTGLLSQRRRPRARAIAFLIGAIASLLLWVFIVTSAVGAVIKGAADDAESTWRSHLGAIDGVLGTLLLLIAIYIAYRPTKPELPDKPPPEDKPEIPLWRIAALGAVLEGRDVSSIILFIAAVQQIARAQIPDEVKLTVLVGLIAITTLPMWLPLIAHVTIPHSFVRRSKPLIAWTRQNRRTIGVAVCLVFGVYLLGRAVIA